MTRSSELRLRRGAWKRLALLVCVGAFLVVPARSQAHPHVWIDAVAELLFDDSRALTGLRVYWAFDELYSTFAVEGLDADGDGEIGPAELAPLAAENIRNLKDFSYFTFVEVNNGRPAYGEVTEYGLHFINGRLAMWFHVPLVTPVDPRTSDVAFALYDPTFYIAIDLVEGDPVRTNGAMPAGCSHGISEPQAPSEFVFLSEAFFESLDASSNFGAQFAHRVRLTCGPSS